MAGARSAARDSRWLLLVCFVSGAASLIFEMVWFHLSGLVFGNSVWATSLVLSSFMGGLTIGSAIVGRSGHRVRRFLRAYAATEVVVAVSGVALTYALPGLSRSVVTVTRPAAENLWLINALRFVTAFTILLVPSTVMGATLPLLIAALARWRASSPWCKSIVAPRTAMRPAGKARRPRIPGVFEGGATPPAGMPRPRGGP